MVPLTRTFCSALLLTCLFCSTVIAEEHWSETSTDFHGYRCYEFQVEDLNCKVVPPKQIASGKPWIWRARFWGHEPQTDLALLDKGYHVVYCDVAGLYGAPAAVDRWNRFYEFLTTKHEFAPKCILEGMSRGGLIVFNWAIANPEKVRSIYLDAPVCDFKSWPGGLLKANGSASNWKECLTVYKLTAQQAVQYEGNPVDQLKPLATANVPLLIVVGDADEVVPVEENSSIVEQRYRELGGPIKVIHKPGVGHHPHSLKDPTPIVSWLLQSQLK